MCWVRASHVIMPLVTRLVVLVRLALRYLICGSIRPFRPIGDVRFVLRGWLSCSVFSWLVTLCALFSVLRVHLFSWLVTLLLFPKRDCAECGLETN